MRRRHQSGHGRSVQRRPGGTLRAQPYPVHRPAPFGSRPTFRADVWHRAGKSLGEVHAAGRRRLAADLSSEDAHRHRDRGRRRHPLRPAALPPMRRGDAVGPPRRARRAGARAPTTSSVVHLHCEGPGRTWRPRWRRTSAIGPCSSGRNARAAVNEGRADYVPVFLSDVPRLFDVRPAAARCRLRNATPPDAHGFCSLGTSVEAMHAAIRAAKTVIVQLNRAMPRTLGDSFIHVVADRPRRRVRRAALRGARSGDRRRRAADRRVRRGPRPRRRDAPARHRRDPRGDRAAFLTTSATSASTPRCSPTPWSTSSRPASITGAPQGAQPGQDRGCVHHGHAPPLRLRATTTRWSRCGRSTSPTTPMSSARSTG